MAVGLPNFVICIVLLSCSDFGSIFEFWQAFFKEHPKFVKNDFFITGESYAGHYIPALASRVHSGNKKKEGIPINLKVSDHNGFVFGGNKPNFLV